MITSFAVEATKALLPMDVYNRTGNNPNLSVIFANFGDYSVIGNSSASSGVSQAKNSRRRVRIRVAAG
jgi:hypothetical protein